MKLNLEKSLIDKYPDLLEEITEISHEDGWYQIIDELLEKIDAYQDEINIWIHLRKRMDRFI